MYACLEVTDSSRMNERIILNNLFRKEVVAMVTYTVCICGNLKWRVDAFREKREAKNKEAKDLKPSGKLCPGLV